jgi:transposase
MERMLERCAGLDVHKKTVTACVRVPGVSGDRVQHVRTFATTTADLLLLRDWLEAHRVSHVAMECTGVYWRPVFYVLEEAATCILANAAQIAQVPGRKTDVNDAVWIAQLLEHGLIRPSFVPPAPFRELRDLTRYRKLLVQERTRHANRLHKVLEDAGIKLTSVATRLLGVSGRAMLDALVAGTTDPTVLADLARGKLRLAARPGRPLPRPPRLPRQPAPRPPRLPGRGHRDRQHPDRCRHGALRRAARAPRHHPRGEQAHR